MSQALSSVNRFYNYKIIDNKSDFLQDKNNDNDLVVSYYVCNGELSFKYQDKDVKIFEDEVVILSSVKKLSNIQILPNTKVFEIKTEMGKLNIIYFLCQAYNGCSYKMSEIIDALERQKSLKFDDITDWLVTDLGAEICILASKTIYMSRGKFRVPELNFD